ncbi:tetratricopeptide repeat protein [bacterium]|nr:tetratricopeptide repeat protein [bacterium]
MSNGESDAIQALCERVDARKLLEAIGFHVEKLRVLGNTLKTPCPIHKDERLATLIVYPDRGTYKCMVSSCDAFKGGTLLDLYCLWSGEKGPAAALGMARLAGVEIDKEILQSVSQAYLREAEQAIEGGDLADAHESLEEARKIDSTSLLVPLVGARLAEHEGRPEDACEDYAIASRLARRQGDLEEAERIVRENLIRLRPDDERTLLELADVLHALQRFDDRNEYLVRVCDLNEREGRLAECLPHYERMKDHVQGDAHLRLRYGKALAAAHETQRAAEELRAAADVLASGEDQEALIEALAGIRDCEPGNTEVRERLAEAYDRAGQHVEYISELSSLGTEALGTGDIDRAEGLFRRILERDAESISAREGLVEVYATRGDKQAEAGEHRHIARLYGDMGLEDQVADHLIAARDADPDDPELRVLLAERMVSDSNPTAAMKEFFDAGRLFFERENPDEGEKIFARLIEANPTDRNTIDRIAGCYTEHDRQNAARDLYRDLARRQLDAGNADHAEEACNKALEFDPGSPELMQLRFESLMQLEAYVPACDLALELHEKLAENEQIDQSLENLESMHQTGEASPALLMVLGRILRDAGRRDEALEVFHGLLEGATDACAEERAEIAGEVLELKPADAPARRGLAQAQEELGQTEEATKSFLWAASDFRLDDQLKYALECFEAAAALAPEHAEALRGIADLQYENGNDEEALATFHKLLDALKSQNDEEAIRKLYDHMLELFEPGTEIRVEFAEWLASIEKNDEAITQFEAIEKDLLKNEEELDRVVDVLLRILAIDSSRREVRLRLADTCEKIGDTEAAAKQYAKAAEEAAEAGEAAKAIELFRTVLRIDPQDENACLRLAEIYAEDGETDLAVGAFQRVSHIRREEDREAENIDIFRRILALDPATPGARKRLAEAYEAAEDVASAIKEWERVASDLLGQSPPGDPVPIYAHLKGLDPKRREPRMALIEWFDENDQQAEFLRETVDFVRLCEEDDDLDTAAEYLDRVRKVFPNDLTVAERLAELQIRRGENKAACTVLADTAHAWEQKGDSENATRLLRRVLEIDPDDFGARRELAEIYEHAGNTTEALKAHSELIQWHLDKGNRDKALEVANKYEDSAGLDWEARQALYALLSSHDDMSDEIVSRVTILAEEAENEGETEVALNAALYGIGHDEGIRRLREIAAHAYRTKGNNDEAAQQFERLTQLAMEAGSRDHAIEYCREHLELEPKDASIHRRLVDLYRDTGQTGPYLSALETLSQLQWEHGAHDAAVEASFEILTKDEKRDGVRERLVEQLLEMGDRERAIAQLDVLATQAEKAKDWAEEEKYLARIHEMGLETLAILRRISTAQWKQEKKEEARATDATVLKIASESASPKEVIDEYSRIIEADADNTALELEFARYLKEHGDEEEAVERYRSVAAKHVDDESMEDAILILSELVEWQDQRFDLLEQLAEWYVKVGDEFSAAELYLNAARGYEHAEDLEASARCAERSHELDASNAVTLRLLAHVQEGQSNFDEALKAWRTIADLNREAGKEEQNTEVLLKMLTLAPEDIETREQLLDLYEKLGRTEEAANQGLELATMCQSAGDMDRATEILRRLKTAAPDNREPRERLVALLEELEDTAGAKDELIELADMAEVAGELEKALEYWQKAFELAPEDTAVGLSYAEGLRQANRTEEAVEQFRKIAAVILESDGPEAADTVYREALELAPDDLDLRKEQFECTKRGGDDLQIAEDALELARRCFGADKGDEALSFCQEASTRQPRNADLRKRVASLQSDNGKTDEASRELLETASEQLEQAEPETAIQILLEAREGTEDAIPILQLLVRAELSRENTEVAFDYMEELASAHAAKDDFESVEGTWQEALELDPESIRAHRGLVDALKSQGDDRLAEALDALHDLSQLYVNAELDEDAAACYREMLEMDDGQFEVRGALAELYVRIDDKPAATEEFLKLARAHREKDDAEAAIEFFQKAREQDGENLEAVESLIEVTRECGDKMGFTRYSLELAEIHEGHSDIDAAIEVVKGLVESEPENTEAGLRLAAYYEKANRLDDAIQVYLSVAHTCLSLGEYTEGIYALHHIERHQPTSVEVLIPLGEAFLDAGETNNAHLHLVQSARLLQRHDEVDRAIEVTERIVKHVPDSSELRTLRAELFEAADNKESASDELSKLADMSSGDRSRHVQILEHLLQLTPDRSDERQKYADCLADLGREEDAVEQFLQLAAEMQKDGKLESALAHAESALVVAEGRIDVHLCLANLHREMGNADGAVKEYLWLAEAATAREDSETALSYFYEGLELAPADVDLHKRLAEFHRSQNEPEEAASCYLKVAEFAIGDADFSRAVDAMCAARDLLPEDATIRKNLSGLLLKLGRSQEALEEQVEIFRIHLSQGLVDEAREQLDRIYDTESGNFDLRERAAAIFQENSIPELAANEYTEIARLSKLKGDFQGVRDFCLRALELKSRDIDARELLVAAYKQLEQIPEAVEVLSELAQIYRENDSIEKSAEALQAMALFQPHATEPRERLAELFEYLGRRDELTLELRELAQLYHERNDIDNAIRTWRRLLEVKPDDTRALHKVIEVYAQAGDGGDVLDDYLRLADIYFEAGEYKPAIDTLEEALKADESNIPLRTRLVDCLLKSGSTDRALEVSREIATLMINEGDGRGALDVLQKVRSESSGDPEFHQLMARAHSAQNARGMALQELRRAAKLFEETDNLGGKASALEEILELDNQDIHVHEELVALLRKMGRPNEAARQQLALADVYVGRGLLDLAEAEYRSIVSTSPDNRKAWTLLFSTHLQFGEEKDLLLDYMALADYLLEQQNVHEALQYYSKIIQISPRSIEARRKYIDAYLRVGGESDLCEEFLALADLLVASDRVDEGIELYGKVMALDPSNREARDRLSATEARVRAGQSVTPPPQPSDDSPRHKPYQSPEGSEAEEEPLESEESTKSAADFLAGAVNEIEDDERAGLEQVVRSYEDILAINPQNANVRVKIANLLEQLERPKQAFEHLLLASETLFQKGEVNLCIEVCERILKIDPTNQKIRVRLKQAYNKRDAFKALESAILFTDQVSGETETGGPRPRRND